MAATPTVYVICDKNCKFEGMTKEQILTAIMQAVESGTISNIDAGFITTIKTINGVPLKFFIGEQAAYDELTDEEKKDLFAIITNDTTKEGILNAIEDLRIKTETLENWKIDVMSGETTVPNAGHASTADSATEAGHASTADNATEAGKARWDSDGNFFATRYFHRGNNAFSGDPTEGVTIECPKTGNYYSATLVGTLAGENINYSFGVFWWDGKTTTETPLIRLYAGTTGVYYAYLEIEYASQKNATYNNGTVTLKGQIITGTAVSIPDLNGFDEITLKITPLIYEYTG